MPEVPGGVPAGRHVPERKSPPDDASSNLARAGGPASTSYKVIDEAAVAVPSNLAPLAGDAPRPSGAQVAEAARRLDIDLVFDADLLFIAEELLMSPVPEVSGDARGHPEVPPRVFVRKR